MGLEGDIRPGAGLWREQARLLAERETARQTLSRPQARAIRGILAAILIFGLLQPAALLILLHRTAFAVFLALILWRLGLGLMTAMTRRQRYHPPLPPGLDCLPRYTVLVPLYREVRALPGLLAAMRSLDYPAERLEVIFLVEADDALTRDALDAISRPAHFTVLDIPPGGPRTKPNALNFGLAAASGSYLTIYDAEDRPHRQQLREAVSAFWHGPDRRACVQAPLIAYNARENWIAAQWALEYRVLFNLILPAMGRLALPIPLGGTSNHFRVDILRSVGGWDAFNVTEDADLGLRIARHGYSVGMITRPTLEEAPISIGAWTAQRSRWIKGYVQTWLVAMRHTRKTLRAGGVAALACIHLTLAGCVLSALAHGAALILIAASLGISGPALPLADLALIAAGLASNTLLSLLALQGHATPPRRTVLTQPLYFLLFTPAAVRAIWSLIRAPHYWAKTDHGRTLVAAPPVQADPAQ